MENQGDPVPRKKKGLKVTTKKNNLKSAKADSVEKGRTYGIGSLSVADTVHAENDSVRREENANLHDSE